MKLDANHRVTGVNWFQEKEIEIGYMVYLFKWNAAKEWKQLSRETYARYRKDPTVTTHGAFRSEMKREWVSACTWCGARPRMIDHCTDGAYLTSTCDSPQCWTTVDTTPVDFPVLFLEDGARRISVTPKEWIRKVWEAPNLGE